MFVTNTSFPTDDFKNKTGIYKEAHIWITAANPPIFSLLVAETHPPPAVPALTYT